MIVTSDRLSVNLKPISIRNQFKKVTCYSRTFLSFFPQSRVKKNKKSQERKQVPKGVDALTQPSLLLLPLLPLSFSLSLLYSHRAIQPTYPWLPSPEKPIDSSLWSFQREFFSQESSTYFLFYFVSFIRFFPFYLDCWPYF